jgi:hypothetical protein
MWSWFCLSKVENRIGCDVQFELGSNFRLRRFKGYGLVIEKWKHMTAIAVDTSFCQVQHGKERQDQEDFLSNWAHGVDFFQN